MAPKPQHWPTDFSSGTGYGYGQKGNSQLPYNPNDPVLGTHMTQGEWDQLRALMRKAEEGGKMNELLTIHNKEVKNAPMNRHYPPDDDEWKDCEENSQSQVPASPPKVHDPSTTNSAAGSSQRLMANMHGRCLQLHLHQLCNSLEGIQGSSMHVNTTRNGKTDHMIRMTILGLKMWTKMERRATNL